LMDLTGYGYDYGYEEDCYYEGEDYYSYFKTVMDSTFLLACSVILFHALNAVNCIVVL
jgi:hypothetical protein